jgi:fluoride ion exporter CrcB/FEX
MRCLNLLHIGPEGALWTGMLNVVSSIMLGYVAVWLGAMLARQ